MLAPHTPPELDSELDSEESTQINQETVRYLSRIEAKLYQDIEARKRIDSGLLFIACQFSSCSLSWLLFELQVTLSIIQLASFCVSCLPGLIDFGDSFNFSISSESWEFSLGQKPLVGIIKLAIGIGVSWQGTTKISTEVANTYAQINQTYQEIRSAEGLSFQLPNMGLSLLIGLSAIALIGIFKKFSNTDNTGVNQNED
ncbi:hypothetical protein H6G06_26155 [Anabaena sphaerica FACHB-251]|uniref:Uncharacterized protein n=1 Tax=Anabaena sphaerica FACHB-251 TaxID=2692883 RepID=A0A926WN74_9NOST|nr:hypothetical protein [Anabaena sphaerica]MBD2296864.1 hypothetical protein [Anabaena sphaerica FACHB-251]